MLWTTDHWMIKQSLFLCNVFLVYQLHLIACIQVMQAYNDRVNLSAQGFYCAPHVYFNWKEEKGAPFYYYSFGVGCSEVEINTLTGSFQVHVQD